MHLPVINIADPNRVPVNPTEEISRIIVGGKSNRWLNISRITAIQGAEDPDYKIFMCEVCEMFDVGGTVFKRCHVSNYTSRVIGAPPVLTINSRELDNFDCYRMLATLSLSYTIGNSSFCVARNVDRVLNLMCDVRNDPSNPPIPLPTPTRSWFKDGNLIYSAQLSAFLDASGFLMNNTILALGVLTPMILTLQQDGQIWYNTRVDNITQPGMIPEVTTIDQARELVFDLSLGMWTCAVNNMFGTAAVEYLIRECGKQMEVVY